MREKRGRERATPKRCCSPCQDDVEIEERERGERFERFELTAALQAATTQELTQGHTPPVEEEKKPFCELSLGLLVAVQAAWAWC